MNEFNDKKLSQLTEKETDYLIELCDSVSRFSIESNTKIRGLGPSYVSALLAAHFVDLIPILDRRILNGAGIKVR